MNKTKLAGIQSSHKKIIHDRQYQDEKEYFKEDRVIKSLNDYALELVCAKCFPVRAKMPQYSFRSAATYDIRYPKIRKMVENQLAVK